MIENIIFIKYNNLIYLMRLYFICIILTLFIKINCCDNDGLSFDTLAISDTTNNEMKNTYPELNLRFKELNGVIPGFHLYPKKAHDIDSILYLHYSSFSSVTRVKNQIHLFDPKKQELYTLTVTNSSQCNKAIDKVFVFLEWRVMNTSDEGDSPGFYPTGISVINEVYSIPKPIRLAKSEEELGVTKAMIERSHSEPDNSKSPKPKKVARSKTVKKKSPTAESNFPNFISIISKQNLLHFAMAKITYLTNTIELEQVSVLIDDIVAKDSLKGIFAYNGKPRMEGSSKNQADGNIPKLEGIFIYLSDKNILKLEGLQKPDILKDTIVRNELLYLNKRDIRDVVVNTADYQEALIFQMNNGVSIQLIFTLPRQEPKTNNSNFRENSWAKYIRHNIYNRPEVIKALDRISKIRFKKA
jgi:hypothetical protein